MEYKIGQTLEVIENTCLNESVKIGDRCTIVHISHDIDMPVHHLKFNKDISDCRKDKHGANQWIYGKYFMDYQFKEIEKVRGFEIISEAQFEKDKIFDMKISDIILPKRGSKKSACYDFFAPCDIGLKPNESITIPTGIKAYMLDDEVLKAYPRSNHGFKFFVRIANTIPIIDADFFNNPKNEGHIFIKIRNEGDVNCFIPKGQGMCQVMFQKYLLADGDNFTDGEDRVGGIGSTNK